MTDPNHENVPTVAVSALVETKMSTPYVDYKGATIPSHPLHGFKCSCGWHSLWYYSLDTAHNSLVRHFAQQHPVEPPAE